MNTPTFSQRKGLRTYADVRREAIAAAERAQFMARRRTDQPDGFARFQTGARSILGTWWVLWLLAFLALSLVSSWAALLLAQLLVRVLMGAAS